MNSVEYQATITKEEVRELPTLTYPNKKIVLIDTEKAAFDAVDVLLRSDVVGFDTETKPAFKKGVSNKMALMQISNQETCFLFRINKIGFPAPLVSFLANDKVQKIGLSLHDDFRVLSRGIKLTPRGFIDLQKIINQIGVTELGLQKMYAILFKKRISKSQRLTNWEAEILNEKQQNYAAIDAWACLDIYKKIQNGL